MDNRTRALMSTAGGAAAEKIYVEDVFSTYLYTGNGSTQRITNNIFLGYGAGVTNTTASSIRSDSNLQSFFSTSYGVFNTVGPGEFLSVDLSQPVTVTSVTYKNGPGSSWAPTQVLVQSSNDGVSWSTQATYSDNGTTNLQTISVTTGAVARYWRLFQNTATRQGTPGYEWHFGSFSLQVTESGPGGVVWTKSRSSINNHWLYSTVQGTGEGKGLITNTSDGITSYPTYNNLSSFNSDGFSLGTATSGNQSNTNATTYASWTFRKAAKFFDVVTYTGNGTSSRYISHNLQAQPAFIIVKRTDSSSDWMVDSLSYSSNVLGGNPNNQGALNSTAAFNWLGGNYGPYCWQSNSTQFLVGLNANASGGTYVAYLFASDAGGFGDSGNDSVIKCGSYTGNGTSPGPTVNLGWEPQWVLIKNATTGGQDYLGWAVFDNMRGVATNGTDSILMANSNAAENTGNNPAYQYIDFTSTGFNLDTGASAQTNQNGNTYIYIAIRRGPMKTPTVGTDVFGAYTFTSPQTFTLPTSWAPDLITRLQRNVDDSFARLFGTRLQGKNVFLSTNSTDAENTSNTVFTFDKTAGQGSAEYGGSGVNLLSYAFRRAPGFFDVVAYTGNGVSNRNVPHNLGIVPELVIIKNRSGTGSDWLVTTNFGVTTASELYLNTTQSQVGGVPQVYGNLTLANKPTSTNLVFGPPYGALNASGVTYVSYLFATCPGVSKVGSYTGTGTTQQINCSFTNGARFVLIKRTDSTGDWYVWDTARGIIAGNDPYLLLNSTAAEVTNTDYIDAYSAGFEISSTAPAAINANGGSYIFLAIA